MYTHVNVTRWYDPDWPRSLALQQHCANVLSKSKLKSSLAICRSGHPDQLEERSSGSKSELNTSLVLANMMGTGILNLPTIVLFVGVKALQF